DYRWYSQELWDEFDVCPDRAACVTTVEGISTAAARSIPHEHEIVHIMQRPTCPYILEEGLADFMRGSYPPKKGFPKADNLSHLLELSFGLAGPDWVRWEN